MLRITALIFFALTWSANAQTNRTELKRADLSGTNMEIVVSVVDVQPGNNLIRHTHHAWSNIGLGEAAGDTDSRYIPGTKDAGALPKAGKRKRINVQRSTVDPAAFPRRRGPTGCFGRDDVR